MPEVVVIGASRGIGNALAQAFANAGWQVTATARDTAGADALDALDGVTGRVCDVVDEASLRALAQALPGQVDVVVVVAGILVNEPELAAIEAATWTSVMTTNALGPLLAARALAGSIRDGGKFVALTSQMGSIAENRSGGHYSYRMSKAALNMGLTNLSLELRPRGIAIGALHPGWVRTEMGGENAAVEVADSVAGLCQVIDRLESGEGVAFLDYQGRRIAW